MNWASSREGGDLHGTRGRSKQKAVHCKVMMLLCPEWVGVLETAEGRGPYRVEVLGPDQWGIGTAAWR